MSAPAMKMSGLPLMSTAAWIDGIALEAPDQLDELVLHGAVELVDRLVRQIERDDGDAILDVDGHRARLARHLGRPGRGRGGHSALSTTIAKPIPPAAHTVMSPNCPAAPPQLVEQASS